MREQWDLLNLQRQPLNLTMFRGDPIPEGMYRIIVHVLLFNDQQQCLIQQRQSHKSSWANKWDFTAGGSIIAGETSQQGASRELREEVCIEMDFTHCMPILTVPFGEGFDDMYIGYFNGDLSQLTLQAEEVQAVQWATLDDILTRIQQEQFVPYHSSTVEWCFYQADRLYGSHTHHPPFLKNEHYEKTVHFSTVKDGRFVFGAIY